MKNNSGQSLFEIIIALAVATMIIVAIVTLAANSISNSIFSKNRSLATRFAQEATEWLRSQRDMSWDNLSTLADGSTYCLQDISSLGSLQLGSCSGSKFVTGSTNIKREVILESGTSGGKNIINVEIKVYWSDGKGDHEVKSSTTFSDWRQRS